MRFLLAAVAAAFIAVPAAAETVNINPGMWEATVAVEMPGMPSGTHEPTRQCLTESDIGAPEDMMSGDVGCELVSSEHSNDVFTYEMKCPEGTITGRMAFNGDTYEGRGSMAFDGGGHEGMEAVMTMRGRRLGPCD